MILFTNVSKIYKNDNGVETIALKEVNFYIDKGEFVFIIGSSGAGKSTIAHLIIRQELPTEGSILINQTDIAQIPTKELPYYRRKVGMVFQDFRLLSGKTVYENVAFALQIVGASKRDVRRKVPAALSLVGLAQKARSKVSELSGGERQRVAIARAIINNPPILLCDEPTGNLDPVTSMEIMEILDKINQAGTTVLIVTHASDIVNAMQKRVIEIQDGVIVRDQKQGIYEINEQRVNPNEQLFTNIEQSVTISEQITTTTTKQYTVNKEPKTAIKYRVKESKESSDAAQNEDKLSD